MYRLEEDIYNVGDQVFFSGMSKDEKALCKEFCVVEYMNTLRVVPRNDLSFNREKQIFSWRGIKLPKCFHIQLKEQLAILIQMPSDIEPPCSRETKDYIFQYFVFRNFMGVCKVLKRYII